MNLSAAAPREPLNSTGSGRHRKVHIVKLVKSMISLMLTLVLFADLAQGTGALKAEAAAGAQTKVLTIAAARTKDVRQSVFS